MKKRAKKRFLEKYDGMKYGWYKMARDFTLMLLGAFLLFGILVGVSKVNGNSMSPTLKNGELVFFTRISTGFEKGDVVFARMPSGKNYVKRIIAVEGDVVDIREGVLYINGEPETGDYLYGITMPAQGIVEYPYEIPAGMLFMVGDNRAGSVDSRSFGALPDSCIRGELIFVD